MANATQDDAKRSLVGRICRLRLPLRGFGEAQAFVVLEREIQAVFVREEAHEIAFLVHHAVAGVFFGENFKIILH